MYEMEESNGREAKVGDDVGKEKRKANLMRALSYEQTLQGDETRRR